MIAADGNVRVVIKEFPILGDDSLFAARAALAAGKQGKYAEMHAALMTFKGVFAGGDASDGTLVIDVGGGSTELVLGGADGVACDLSLPTQEKRQSPGRGRGFFLVSATHSTDPNAD